MIIGRRKSYEKKVKADAPTVNWLLRSISSDIFAAIQTPK